MLLVLFSTLLLLIIFTGFGLLTSKLHLQLWTNWSGLLISGIITCSLVLTGIAFFFPTTLFIEAVMVGIGLASFLTFGGLRVVRDFYIQHQKYWITPFLFILFASSFHPYILDHFGYYVPTINYLNTYGITKGVGNLDIILAQTSLWHILQSGFGHFIDPYFRLNSVLPILYTIYIFEKRAWRLLLFMPLFYLFVSSPSPDLPVLVLSLIALNELLSDKKDPAKILVLSTFVFCIKPTLIWLPLLAFIWCIVQKKWSLKSLGITVAVAALFIVKNYITFGFPIIPVDIGDLDLAWKPHPVILKESSETAILKTYDFQYTIHDIRNFSTSDYIINWFTLKGIKSKIHLLFILSLLAFSIYTWIQKNKFIRWLWVTIMFKSILVLVFSAQYRFFLDVFLVIGFLLTERLNRKYSVFCFYIFSMGVLGSISFPQVIQRWLPSFNLGHYMKSFQIDQVYRPGNYVRDRYHTYQIGNLKFNISEAYPFIFDTPAPSISPVHLEDYLKLKSFPQYRDSTQLKSGFILSPINEKDQQKLRSIIKNWKESYPSKTTNFSN